MIKLNNKLFKDTLVQKLADEGTGFTARYVKMRKVSDSTYKVWIEEYEFNTMTVKVEEEEDEYFRNHFGLYRMSVVANEDSEMSDYSWGNNLDRLTVRTALHLGYDIAIRY